VHESDLVTAFDRPVVDHLNLANRHVDDLTDRLPDRRVVHVPDHVQIGPA
jgi:hypothetical protein